MAEEFPRLRMDLAEDFPTPILATQSWLAAKAADWITAREAP